MPRCFATDCAGRYFPNKEALQQHLRSSSLPHPVCNLCKRRFINETSKNEHMAARHPPTFTCEDCQRDFNSLSALNDHYRGSPPERHPNCPKCGLGFRNIADRDAHEASDHPQVKCSACNGELIYEDRLQYHYTERSPPHSLCEICQQGFKDVAELSMHKSGAHPVCTKCKTRFKVQEELDVHVKNCQPSIEAHVPIYTTSGSIHSKVAPGTGHSSHGSPWKTSSVMQVDSHGQQLLRSTTGTPQHWNTQWMPSSSALPVELHDQPHSAVTPCFQPSSGLRSSPGPSNVRVSTNPLPRHFSSWQNTPNHNLPNSLQAVSSNPRRNQNPRNFAFFDQGFGTGGALGGFWFLGNGNL